MKPNTGHPGSDGAGQSIALSRTQCLILRGTFGPVNAAFNACSQRLALADRTLGKLRHAMETSGQWDKTWLILSADHSWRESPRYDGRRDLRVPFLIKAPGPGKSITCSPPINTSLTHDLVLAILHGEPTDQQQTVAWLEAHPSVPAPLRATVCCQPNRA